MLRVGGWKIHCCKQHNNKKRLVFLAGNRALIFSESTSACTLSWGLRIFEYEIWHSLWPRYHRTNERARKGETYIRIPKASPRHRRQPRGFVQTSFVT